MTDPYSDRLYIGDVSPAGGTLTLATVPTGERWVLRDLRVRVSASGKLFQLYVQTATAQIGGILRETSANTDAKRWVEDRVTLRAGDQLLFYGDSGASYTLYFSGYRLTV